MKERSEERPPARPSGAKANQWRILVEPSKGEALRNYHGEEKKRVVPEGTIYVC